MERQFDQSLKEVKRLLLEMGEKLEIAIDKSVKSLASLNGIMARDVLEKDHKIDELEDRIDEKVAQLIATQQPVAKDLRKLIAAMKIASDMERMADLAANVAEVTVYFVENDLKLFTELKDIPNMARITQKMVHDGINSYIDGNVEMSKKMAQTDDQVDDLYEKVVKELLQMVFHKVESTDAEKDVALRLCFVARYLERIADHATNIGESIVYIETGKRVDLN
ncbi:phosphate transport system regulatory protein PhoU [Marinithermofilum abyssi]|uniref:Phosphate-specific transport system accessory protein PhoU n=1 Tax=Marinithermofilum abyssi TaxID=1571185 RepID=A0A8J2VF75_9BACL|nr:phosphate signaling complex protein PhoU [Marinithermofilum abyssi]GGE17519.1 phosphate transport system regulatory protein PhoU [Marinithermofilum abyssi]